MQDLAGVRFDSGTGVLSKADSSYNLEPKAADVLALLFRERGTLVSRQRLLDECWGEASGSDEALTQAIAQIRRGLETVGAPRDLLTTYPKRGYRLSPETDTVRVEKGKAGASAWLMAAALIVLVAGLTLALATRPGWPRHAIRHALGLGPQQAHHRF